jgi:hypothetical protein
VLITLIEMQIAQMIHTEQDRPAICSDFGGVFSVCDMHTIRGIRPLILPNITVETHEICI